MSFRKAPRLGQQQVFDSLGGRKYLNIQLPTGYGKSYTCAGVYSILKSCGRVNRLLVVFPTLAQIKQFVQDAPADLADANVDGPRGIYDVSFFETEALRLHRKNEAQIFAITAQALIAKKGREAVGGLMEVGRWMVCVDEYHHYGLEKRWGQIVKALPAEFLLAMSATPYRKDDDSAFGPPDVRVRYRDAAKQQAVKELKGHAYVYRIDAIGEDGEPKSYTTNELADEAGTDNPEGIERFRILRKMRWSPKYVSPLVTVPIERMLRDRLSTGHPLQAIVGAMCVSHARLVCEQVKAAFPELRVDWVGTGAEGRSDADNAAVLKRFCPPKDDRGRRSPTLDVLVHVGMAGEGLDSIHVSEVIHLNKASVNNSNNQENGRAARYLDGVQGNINFDSSSEYAVRGYIGAAIMDAMDSEEPRPDEDQDEQPQADDETRDVPELPDEPAIQIWDMELVGIHSGDPEVQLYKEWLVGEKHCGFTAADIQNPDSPLHELAVIGYRNMRRKEAEQHNAQAVVEQWRDAVKTALTVVTGRVVRMLSGANRRFDKTLPGDVKRRINRAKKAALGEISADPEVCRRHYQWLKNLERDLIEKGVPMWLV